MGLHWDGLGSRFLLLIIEILSTLEVKKHAVIGHVMSLLLLRGDVHHFVWPVSFLRQDEGGVSGF